MIYQERITTIVNEFFSKYDQNILAAGSYQLHDGVYVNVEEYITQNRKDRFFEMHKKYIDVQYIISGEEIITLCKPEVLIERTPYDINRDIVFFENQIEGMDYYLNAGRFLIIQNGIAHMPCVAVNNNQNVKKAVFKIPVK